MKSDEATNDEAHRKLIGRVTELESLFTHLQQTIKDLNQVVLDQQRQLDATERQLSRILRDVMSLSAGVAEPRTAEEEKPPHY